MASHQAQGPDPLRSRSSHIGYLTKQCNAIDHMISGTASHAEAVSAQKALHHRYMSYLESHELALAAVPDPNTLTQSHISTAERHNHYCELIRAYIESFDVPSEPRPLSPFSYLQALTCNSHCPNFYLLTQVPHCPLDSVASHSTFKSSFQVVECPSIRDPSSSRVGEESFRKDEATARVGEADG